MEEVVLVVKVVKALRALLPGNKPMSTGLFFLLMPHLPGPMTFRSDHLLHQAEGPDLPGSPV